MSCHAWSVRTGPAPGRPTCGARPVLPC
jgi:hypothetical protein